MCAKSLQLYLTLCDPMDCSPPGSSVHGIFPARILEYPPFATPGDLPDPRIEAVSLLSPASAGKFFTINTTWEAQAGKTIWISQRNPDIENENSANPDCFS